MTWEIIAALAEVPNAHEASFRAPVGHMELLSMHFGTAVVVCIVVRLMARLSEKPPEDTKRKRKRLRRR